ncbi:MAG TPA: LptA/OstA family protein [Myxococcaceae bacterium]|nr:LptA/OstA family protein [Myxococcaceae bacterium]
MSLDGRRWGLLGALLVASLASGQTAAPRSSSPPQKPVAGKPAPARPGKAPAAAPAPTDPARTPLATPENPVFVDCDKGRMEGATQRFVCTGHVKMVRNTTTLTCERSIGHYLGKDATQVTRLECFGNVQAVDGERWARGDYADYDTVKEVLVLTGNPEARQGTNTMRGDRVVFYVDTDLIEVERVKGVLESKGKEPGQKKATPAAPAKAP